MEIPFRHNSKKDPDAKEVSPLVLILTGPRAVGKTEIKDILTERNYGWSLPKITTRAPREGETQVKDKEFIDQKRFDTLQKEGKLSVTCAYKGCDYGVLQEVEQEALTKQEDIIITATGFGIFKAFSSHFPDAVSVLVYSSIDELLQRKVLRDKIVTEASLLEEFIQEMKKYEEHQELFTYIVENPSPFGFAVGDIFKQDHVAQVARAANLVAAALEWEKIYRETPTSMTRNMGFINHLVGAISDGGTMKQIERQIKKKGSYQINFPKDLRGKYAHDTSTALGMIPESVSINPTCQTYGVISLFIDNGAGEQRYNGYERKIILDLFERKAVIKGNMHAIYAEVADQGYPEQDLSSYGKVAIGGANIQEGGLITLRRDLGVPTPDQELHGLNLGFVRHDAQLPLKPQGISLQRLAEKARNLYSQARSFMIPRTYL